MAKTYDRVIFSKIAIINHNEEIFDFEQNFLNRRSLHLFFLNILVFSYLFIKALT